LEDRNIGRFQLKLLLKRLKKNSPVYSWYSSQSRANFPAFSYHDTKTWSTRHWGTQCCINLGSLVDIEKAAFDLRGVLADWNTPEPSNCFLKISILL